MIPLRFGQGLPATYGGPLGGAPPPLHFVAYTGYEHAPWERPDMSRAQGMVPLTTDSWVGYRNGEGQNVGYVGMDPGDPSTHVRPFRPSRGMFSRLHEEQPQAVHGA